MLTSSEERHFFRVCIRLVFFAVSLATVVSLLSRMHWFAELFSHFRFYFLLTQALLLLIFLHSERWFLLAATLVLAIPNAWYVTPYLTPFLLGPSIVAAGRDDVEVVALNVDYRNHDHSAVRAYLDSASPDVILLAEVTDAWRDGLRFLDADYPHQIGESRPDPWGMRVYSRRPLVEAELLDLGVAGTVHARIMLETDAGPLQIFAAHLYPPTNPRRAAQRNTQLLRLAARVRESDTPTAVIGDLNVTPFSPYFDSLLNDGGLVDARRPAGFHFTWPTSALPLWIPIDHALANPAVRVSRVRRGPAVGSDHYPLEVSIAHRFR